LKYSQKDSAPTTSKFGGSGTCMVYLFAKLKVMIY